MYQITYQKKDGTLFNRERFSLPGYVGQETSMGWIIKDIKYNFNGKYYSLREYQILMDKMKKRNKIIRKFNYYIKKYAIFLLYVPLLLIQVKK